MKTITKILLGSILFMTSCFKERLPPSINPTDVNTLSKFITLDEGAVSKTGTLPSPDNSITIAGINPSITSSNGSTASVVIRFSNSNSGNIAGYYINIEGSNIYYKVPISSVPSSGLLTIPIGLPTVLEAGSFCVNVMTYNASGQTSNIVQQCIQVVKLGSGALQVNLSWDTNYTDIDLHVIDPSGTEIYWYDPYSYATDGQLDRDDVDGFGPENIFWNENAPDGEYKVYVHYFDGYGLTKCFLNINGTKDSKSFVKTLDYVDDWQFVTRIVKSGDRLTFYANENARENNLEKRVFPKKGQKQEGIN